MAVVNVVCTHTCYGSIQQGTAYTSGCEKANQGATCVGTSDGVDAINHMGYCSGQNTAPIICGDVDINGGGIEEDLHASDMATECRLKQWRSTILIFLLVDIHTWHRDEDLYASDMALKCRLIQWRLTISICLVDIHTWCRNENLHASIMARITASYNGVRPYSVSCLLTSTPGASTMSSTHRI